MLRLRHLAILFFLLFQGTAQPNDLKLSVTPQARIAFRATFDEPNALSGWNSGAAIIQRTNGRSALFISRSNNSVSGAIMAFTTLSAEAIRGCRVRCEATVRGANVLRPPNAWNGIKMMLHTDSPSEGKRWDQQNNVFGTFDWRTIRFTTWVPDDLSNAQLYLGLENTTGEVWFDEVKVVVIREATKPLPAIAQAPVYRGHNLPRLRGAMIHPDISEASLRLLGTDWNANLIRWQLIRYVAPAKETTLDEYESWLETELVKLDRRLPLCAELGVRVALDLHSPPGGSRTSSGYIGSDAGLFTNSAAQAMFVRIWEKMAERYKENESIWGYDLANEPVEEEIGEGCEDWQALATRAARAIRAIDKRHAIIVEPSPWGGPAAIRNLDPIPVTGIVYSVHMYLPHAYTHQGIQGNAGAIRYPGQVNGRAWDKDALRRALQPVVAFQREHNAHIYLGEFSAIRWAPGAVDYLRDCIDLFEEYGWDWSYHAFREYHGWSLEHDSEPQNTNPSTTLTDRQKLVTDWFKKNRKH